MQLCRAANRRPSWHSFVITCVVPVPPLASFLPACSDPRPCAGASLGFVRRRVRGALARYRDRLIARFDSVTPVAVYLAIVCALIAVAAYAARETAHIDLKDAGH